MKTDERLDRRRSRSGSSGGMSTVHLGRYWFGAPPREWLAVLFLPASAAVIVAALAYEIDRSEPPRTAVWLAFALGLGGGLVAGLAYTLRLALEHRLFVRDAAAIYGGIHFEQGDLDARETGRIAARIAWEKAQEHWNGS